MTSLPQTDDPKRAMAQIFSVIRGVSVPLGFTTPDKPNVASTIWQTGYDRKNRVMYFDSATSPNVFWLPLEGLAFDAGSPVQKIALKAGETYGGNASASMPPPANQSGTVSRPRVFPALALGASWRKAPTCEPIRGRLYCVVA